MAGVSREVTIEVAVALVVDLIRGVLSGETLAAQARARIEADD